MNFPLTTLVAALGLAAGAAAAAPDRHIASNGFAVAGSAERFEVYARVAMTGGDAFCAAGDFARSALGARATDRVTIVTGLGPSATRPNQRSVTFRLSGPDPQGFVGSGPLIRPQRAGTSLTVANAQFLCRDRNANLDD